MIFNCSKAKFTILPVTALIAGGSNSIGLTSLPSLSLCLGISTLDACSLLWHRIIYLFVFSILSLR